MNARIADLIRENAAEEITDAVAEGGFFEMQTFTQALIEHVLAGQVDREVAANAATNRHDFLVALDHALKRQRRRRRARKQADEDAATSRSSPSRSTETAARAPPRAGRRLMRRLVAAALGARAGRGLARAAGPPSSASRSFAGVPAAAPLAAERRRRRTQPGSISCRPPPSASPAVPVAAAARTTSCSGSGSGRRRVRDPVAGARRDQQDRVELRPQHGAELGRRGRLDAVHAVRPGCAGASTRTATASPTRGTPRTRSTRRRATSPRRAAAPTSRAASSPTTTPTGTSTRCSTSRRSTGGRDRRRRSTCDSCRRSSTAARQAVVGASEQLQAAQAREQQLRSVSSTPARAGRGATALLSDRLAAEQPRSALDVRVDAAARGRPLRLVSALATGAGLARDGDAERRRLRPSHPAPGRSWAPRVPRRLRLPGRRRPAARLRRAHHHDYPAADIAAPAGSPVYALVERGGGQRLAYR